jgi:hypothetical protein
MQNLEHRVSMASLVCCLALTTALVAGGAQNSPNVVIPQDASALEGTPTVRVDATSEGTTRQQLDRDRAASEALRIKIVDGKYFWASRQDRPLMLTTAGEFTYLTSAEPGKYVRFRKINDRLSYVEHVDMGFGSVTYWGELRIVIGK